MRQLTRKDFKEKSWIAWTKIATDAGFDSISDYIYHHYHTLGLSYRKLANRCGRSRADVATRVQKMGIARARGGLNNPSGRRGAEQRFCVICGCPVQRVLCDKPGCYKERARQWAAGNYERNNKTTGGKQTNPKTINMICSRCDQPFVSASEQDFITREYSRRPLYHTCPDCARINEHLIDGECYGGVSWV